MDPAQSVYNTHLVVGYEYKLRRQVERHGGAVRIAHDVAIELVRREGAHALRLERDAQLAGCEPAAHEDCWSGVYHQRIL